MKFFLALILGLSAQSFGDCKELPPEMNIRVVSQTILDLSGEYIATAEFPDLKAMNCEKDTRFNTLSFEFPKDSVRVQIRHKLVARMGNQASIKTLKVFLNNFVFSVSPYDYYFMSTAAPEPWFPYLSVKFDTDTRTYTDNHWRRNNLRVSPR